MTIKSIADMHNQYAEWLTALLVAYGVDTLFTVNEIHETTGTGTYITMAKDDGFIKFIKADGTEATGFNTSKGPFSNWNIRLTDKAVKFLQYQLAKEGR